MIGFDEVGRGALAGPLVVAGCYFIDTPPFIDELKDSKILSRKRREQLCPLIESYAITKIVTVPAVDVDTLGLTVCIRRAIITMLGDLPKDQPIMLDGVYNFLKDTKYSHRTTVEIKADTKYYPVMAAAIIAKVYRDTIMKALSRTFHEYDFEHNMGYGTSVHLQALRTHGPCTEHRRSYKPVKIQMGK